jgi:hypothetical protein
MKTLGRISTSANFAKVTKSRAIGGLLIFVYCVALFLGFDFLYSSIFFHDDEYPSPRIAHPEYHHGLVPNFDGYDVWGSPYRFYTNSLGFKDGKVRDVPLDSDNHRILLMGDSFTEGMGMIFEESFAGMLYAAGKKLPHEVEFLNAGVASYSPISYYKKTKSLLQQGLHFDEIVVFPDLSDISDEASGGFCMDEDPRYLAYCKPTEINLFTLNRPRKRRFAVTSKLMLIAKYETRRLIAKWRGGLLPNAKLDVLYELSSWTIPSVSLTNHYGPLGVEGGIARAVQNMQKLADLLAKHKIPLTVAVYPWPVQLAYDDRASRQVAVWRDFCARNCKQFINLFPAFFVEKDAHEDWYERLFIHGDAHFSAEGNKVMFRGLAKHLLEPQI